MVVDPERTWLMKKEMAGGGLLYDIGSHMIDMLLYLFGEVETATGISCNQSREFDVNDTTGLYGLRTQEILETFENSGTICYSNKR